MKNAHLLPNPVVTAEKLLAKAGITTPPVELAQVLSVWSNLFIVEEELDGSGYLLPIGELGAEILVNKDHREERKRFTVAHELGHWVLGLTLKKKVGHFAQPKNVHHAETERWCDTFATNVLMPEFMVKANVPHSDPVLAINLIVDAAARFKVSEEAFFIRLWETLRFQVAFVAMEGRSGEEGFSLVRSFAGEEEGVALERLLAQRLVAEQLGGSRFPILSFSSAAGKVRCAGRRLSDNRTILVLKWPDPICK
jgi:hypothetical protein